LRAIVSAAGIADISADFKTTNKVCKRVIMKLVFRTLLVALAALAIASTAFGQADFAGSKDYPGITRMPDMYIYSYRDIQFDSAVFRVTQNGKKTDQTIEGRKVVIDYEPKQGTAPVSKLQIIRNLQNAVRTAGGQVIDDSPGTGWYNTTLRFAKGSKEVWVQIETGNGSYTQTVVEREVMKQDVTVDAAAMASSIADSGSVAIYGINFDTASSVIKPDSEPAIDEIAKLLTNNPTLKVGIVGHTDMVGDATSNMKLSQARAQSVINELASKHRIAAARLVAFGAGPWAPVASNDTDEGRAKNRRVELVKITTK
jgi:outer membrane protein OmpA-like peptidoglycan-associated protein